MPCADCERINQEILRKAKEVADALLSPFKPDDAALQQDGTEPT